MAEDINCYEKIIKPPKKPGKPGEPDQDDTRSEDGKYQTTSDWMRRGGKKPDVTVR
jgi:hypothetical protein